MKQPPPKLAAEWNRRLADSGFHDIERPDGILETNRGAMHEDMAATSEERAAYFRMARDFAASKRAARLPPRERKVWEMHADGASQREIAAAMGHASPHRVTDIIVRLRAMALGGQSAGGDDRKLPRDTRPAVGGSTWTRKAVERMDDATLAGLLPLLASALARIGRGSSGRRTR